MGGSGNLDRGVFGDLLGQEKAGRVTVLSTDSDFLHGEVIITRSLCDAKEYNVHRENEWK